MSEHSAPPPARTCMFYGAFGAQERIGFLVNGLGEPVGLQVDRTFYRVTPAPRLRSGCDWHLQPLMVWMKAASETNPDPAG